MNWPAGRRRQRATTMMAGHRRPPQNARAAAASSPAPARAAASHHRRLLGPNRDLARLARRAFGQRDVEHATDELRLDLVRVHVGGQGHALLELAVATALVQGALPLALPFAADDQLAVVNGQLDV